MRIKQYTLVAAVLAVLSMLAGAPVASATGSSVAGSSAATVEAKVMTQNLYIGVDLDRILRGESPAAVFNIALASDFPGRAAAFAEQVSIEQPDLVGLQEVTNIVVFNAEGQVLNNIDYLDIVLANLGARGLNYEVSSVVANADVTLPLDLEAGLFARVIDRDVIIHNAENTTVANQASGNFSTNFAFPLAGTSIEFTRGFTAVDATVDGSEFRFVNTHLEVANAPCATPDGVVICQDVQAEELVAELLAEPLPVVLVGDFNTAVGEKAYQTIANGDYADVWDDKDGDGNTCCQAELLNNTEDELSKRIDLVFYRERATTLVSASNTVITAKTAGGSWYSDHAGVVSALVLESSLCASVTPTIEGTDASETLNGTNGNDVIFAYGGADKINGRGGDDIICAGDGDDTINAGPGDDIADPGEGDDTVNAGTGNDLVIGLDGSNRVRAGDGNDVILTGDGDDTIWAGDGDDVIDAGDGNNVVGGSDGNDQVTTGSGDDVIYLGRDNDTASSGAGNDRVYGGPGIDVVDGGSGEDVCYGDESTTGCES